MYETTKLAYRVSEPDVTRARNQVDAVLIPLSLKSGLHVLILIELGIDSKAE